jgi:hypothetical protein
MRSILPFAAAGGAGVLWGTLPRYVKYPAAIALIALGLIELNKDANESWFSNAIFAGNAAQGEAQTADAVKARRDMDAGTKDVPTATRQAVVNYEEHAALALQKQAEAVAAVESEKQLRAKQDLATSTEALKLKEIELRQRELALRTAEAKLKTAEATNSDSNAAVTKAANEMALKLFDKMNHNGAFNAGTAQERRRAVDNLFGGFGVP